MTQDSTLVTGRNAEGSSVDPAELAKFEAMAADWWDPNGKFKPLHMLNPTRLDYIISRIGAEFGRDARSLRPFEGLRILDIGCGGGLLTEPMARLGAEVVGADAVERNISVASLHAEQQGLEIDYRATTAEALAAAGERFDAVLALEIVEHVADPADFIATCAALTRPEGVMIVSTLNRTPKSFGAAIIGAEWIMRWLPKGTHEWHRFITPEELAAMMAGAGIPAVDRRGMVFNPIRWDWSLSDRDLSVNYIMTGKR
jgi:2-polyprenyl-6-hydroxyphenyl methylase/3-demethylubiquinone-9 3-methyltransferase